MEFPDRIDYRMEGSTFTPPRMFHARQLFESRKLVAVGDEVRRQFARLPLPDLTGKRVCLTGSSRGIADQALILAAAASFLKERGALPFLVPAMGSHGGATPDGQTGVLAGYGIREETVGMPIFSGMDVVKLGNTASGFPVYCDAFAAAADFILPINRVKTHSEFKGPIESGLCKIMVIGLGKHKGCSAMHALGVGVFTDLIPEAAGVFLASGKILAGLAVVENAFDETMLVEAILPEHIIPREKALLEIAKNAQPRFYTSRIDVLIIEEIGKDIGGGGMDTNITGRPGSGLPGFSACPIRRIVVLNISERSHGNGSGMGTADVVTVDFMKQLDLGATYTNHFASRIIDGGHIPIVANTDHDAIRIAAHCCEVADPSAIRYVQLTNTLCMSDILLSESYLPEVTCDPRFRILSTPKPMHFTANRNLERLPRA